MEQRAGRKIGIMDIVKQLYNNLLAAERAKVQDEERRIIMDYTTAGKITPQGINSTVKEMKKAIEAALQLPPARRKPELVIANATTAATIRKNFDRETVEVIITPAAETGTAYVVTDETLKEQLLAAIGERR